MEIWKEIPDYEDYQISNFGNVRKNGSEIKKYTVKGHNVIKIKNKYLMTARLVGTLFLNEPKKRFIKHINGINTDDHVLNLEWTDEKKYNQNIRRGEHHGMAILTADEVREIRELHKTEIYKIIAAKFNVSIGCIQGVVSKTNWKEIK